MIEGKWVAAGVSFGAAIPLAGQYIASMRTAKNAQKATSAAKQLDNISDAVKNGGVGTVVVGKADEVAGPVPSNVLAPSGILHSKDFRRAVQGFATHSPAEATRRLRQLAKDEYGLNVDIRVIDPADWTHRGSAAIKGIQNGKVVVRIKNGPLDEISGVMRHEVTHVWQDITQPLLTK